MKFERHTYASRNQELTDFAIGFVGWYVANAVVSGGLYFAGGFVQSLLSQNAAPGSLVGGLQVAIGLIVSSLPLLLNIAALLVLGFTRYWMALGALAAFALTLFIVLCAALAFAALCFIGLAGGNFP